MNRLYRINRLVRNYDSRLFAVLSSDGVIHVLREGAKPGDSDYSVEGYSGRPNPQFIFALTDNWQLSGMPVEWGLIPIYKHLVEMDAWNRFSRPEDRILSLHKEQEKQAEIKEKETINNNRALAMELRKDFAKGANDFVIPAGQKDTTKVFLNQSLPKEKRKWH